MQNNVLYWTYSKGYDTKKAYKYDIDTNTASLIIDLTDGRAFYATSALRVDPKTDCKMDAVAVDEGKEAVVDLSNVCTDADNFQAAIVKTVQSVTDEAVATATVKNGKLVVKGMLQGPRCRGIRTLQGTSSSTS